MSDLSSTGGFEGWVKKADRRLRSVEGAVMKARIPRVVTSTTRPDPSALQPGVMLFESDTSQPIWVNAGQTGYQTLADHIAALGGTRRGTAAQRTALTPAQRLDQLRFYETDTRKTWVYSAAGGYWFGQNAMATLTFAGSRINLNSNFVTLVPYDTVDSNEDTNLYSTALNSSAGITINRSGIYRVTMHALVAQDAVAYTGALIRTNGTTLREANVTMQNGRLFNTLDWRVGEGGAQVNAAVYLSGANPYFVASSGVPSYALEVARIGD